MRLFPSRIEYKYPEENAIIQKEKEKRMKRHKEKAEQIDDEHI